MRESTFASCFLTLVCGFNSIRASSGEGCRKEGILGQLEANSGSVLVFLWFNGDAYLPGSQRDATCFLWNQVI